MALILRLQLAALREIVLSPAALLWLATAVILGILITLRRRNQPSRTESRLEETSWKAMEEAVDNGEKMKESRSNGAAQDPSSNMTAEKTVAESQVKTSEQPRRRSYTKTVEGGMEVEGEIIVAEGWRRHTRVYGGGVCQACLESERRMREMGFGTVHSA